MCLRVFPWLTIIYIYLPKLVRILVSASFDPIFRWFDKTSTENYSHMSREEGRDFVELLYYLVWLGFFHFRVSTIEDLNNVVFLIPWNTICSVVKKTETKETTLTCIRVKC